MRFPAVNQERSAVLFMEDGAVSRQMLFQEFEAVLDHVVAMEEFSNREVQAVYIQIDHALRIVAAAFFLLRFDQTGLADSDWNTPLELLVSRANTGPDLGAGPIRLVCRNRCPIAWHQAELWDPSLSGERNAFNRLRDAVRENRLALPILAPPEPSAALLADTDDIPTLCEEASVAESKCLSEVRDRTARRLRTLRLKLSLLRSEHEEQLARLCTGHRDDLHQSGQLQYELEQQLVQEQEVNAHLKSLLEPGASGQPGEAEGSIQHTVATAELQEALERKDLALRERDSRIEQLAADIAELKSQKLELQEQAVGGDFLYRLSAAGINYVACQPGAGEFRVPEQDIVAYLESPLEYAAKFCYVDLEHYKAWLRHDERPRCGQTDEHGKLCDLPVHRVDAPATFVPGESDRCSQHRASSLTLSRVMNLAG